MLYAYVLYAALHYHGKYKLGDMALSLKRGRAENFPGDLCNEELRALDEACGEGSMSIQEWAAMIEIADQGGILGTRYNAVAPT